MKACKNELELKRSATLNPVAGFLTGVWVGGSEKILI